MDPGDPMTTRRRFVALATGLLGVPRFAAAQQPAKVWRVGLLTPYSHQALVDDGRYGALLTGLRELGYVEGRNLVIEARYSDGDYARMPDLAAELVQLKVDVIVATPSPAIRAAQHATTTIPIVFPNTGDPVGSGFVASLAHPGGNLTGLSNSNLDVSAKTLELLRACLPKVARIAVLANPGSSTEAAMIKSLGDAARSAGVELFTVEARSPEEIEAGFTAMKRERADAVVVASDALFGMQRHQIAALALEQRLPSIAQGGYYPKGGGLMGYGVNSAENYRLAAGYVDKIFKGAKPADLPVEQPTRLELVINMKTAKALGITVPQLLLMRANELIE
jgi:putative ABC transport system substrate-binding protein